MTPAKIALIVGGSRGLGLTIARDLVDRGWTVVLSARGEDGLNRAAENLRAASPDAQVHTRPADIRSESEVEELVTWTESSVGPIAAVFAVAGVIQVAPLAAVSKEHLAFALDTMTWGPIHVAFAVLPRMRERGHGHIGIVTSIGGMVSAPHLLAYATAKFATVGFGDGLAAALAGTGVTCTTIAPGLMRTGGHLAAEFGGDAAKEYAWFSTAASLPILSANADRAAHRFVSAVLAGRPYVSITPLAWAAVRVRGLFPGTTTRLLGLVNRLLPSATGSIDGSGETVPGRDIERNLGSSVVRALTTLGAKAARRNNETQ